jgi:hypothetical protein
MPRWFGESWGGVSRFLRRAPLSTAVIAAIIAAAAAAFLAYAVLQRVLPTQTAPVEPKDLTQFSLAIVAGIGGVVALVVAYRRQQGTEQSRFVERFGAASNQLGHPDAAVRLAGVYAMAGVADEGSDHERQQCIDVLCGYLRLPYSPALGANHASELQHKVPAREGEESTHRYLFRQNDKEVRQTIVRVIATHVREDSQESWSWCDFDFRGATLEDANFQGSVFAGARTLFDGAAFSGEETSFGLAVFYRWVSFDRAVFSGRETSFTLARFKWSATFRNALFNADRTSFGDAKFEGSMQFNGAVFSGSEIFFSGAKFGGGGCSFKGCDFGEGKVSFHAPSQWDPPPEFDWDASLPSEKRKPQPKNVLPPGDWPPQLNRWL